MAEVALRLLSRDEIAVNLSPRSERGKGAIRKLRREQGQVPGILYGHDQAPFAFHTEGRILERTFQQNGQSLLFKVVHASGADPEHAIVREVQFHKVTGAVLHVDLLRIDPTETRIISVPIQTRGVPEGVRTGGGALQHAVNSLDMECVISEMPSAVEIEIDSLEIGDNVHVSDLLEQEPRIVTDPDVAIVSVLAPRLTVDEELELAGEVEEELEGEPGEEGEAGEGEEEEAGEGEEKQE